MKLLTLFTLTHLDELKLRSFPSSSRCEDGDP